MRWLSLIALMSFGCSGKDTDETDTSAHEDLDVALAFAPMAGTQPFACGTPVTGIGTSASTWDPLDFRLFVSNVRLIRADGEEVPLELEQDGAWQYESTALLDFEDGSGSCNNGNTNTNTTIRGTVPDWSYTGVRFDVGVPFDLNHGDVGVAPSPLNLSSMFWNWEGGYKFIRLEGKTTGQPDGYILHLGSTGCVSDVDGNVTACDAENIVPVELTDLNPVNDTIVVDIAALFATTNVDEAGMMMAGCMSGPGDAACAPVFDKLGLTYDGVAPTGSQKLFRAE